MKLVPLADKIVIKQAEAQATTKGGLILSTQSKEKPQIAEVIAVGPGIEVAGTKIEMTVKPGDKIIYPTMAGVEFKFNDEVFRVIKLSDVMAVIVED